MHQAATWEEKNGQMCNNKLIRSIIVLVWLTSFRSGLLLLIHVQTILHLTRCLAAVV